MAEHLIDSLQTSRYDICFFRRKDSKQDTHYHEEEDDLHHIVIAQ